MTFPKEFWSKKYSEPNQKWDIGYISTPLKSYIDQLKNREIKILVPGAGNGYEVAYLWEMGFKDLYVVDIAPEPLVSLEQRVPKLPESRLIEEDFFKLDEGEFDLVLEQTFFCALPPEARSDYVKKMWEILKPGGKLAGLFFSFPLTSDGPPFGGSEAEYRSLFSPYFNLLTLEPAYNSIPPRAGNELFFIFERKHLLNEK